MCTCHPVDPDAEYRSRGSAFLVALPAAPAAAAAPRAGKGPEGATEPGATGGGATVKRRETNRKVSEKQK